MSVPWSSACTSCGDKTHQASKCPDLTSDLNLTEGFYSGAGASGGHGDEEDMLHKRSKVSLPLTIQIYAYPNIGYDGGAGQSTISNSDCLRIC